MCKDLSSGHALLQGTIVSRYIHLNHHVHCGEHKTVLHCIKQSFTAYRGGKDPARNGMAQIARTMLWGALRSRVLKVGLLHPCCRYGR